MEDKFDLHKEFEAWYVDTTGNTASCEEDAFYDMINYVDFLLDRLIRLEKKTERIKEILALSEEDEDEYEGEYEYDDLDCDGDE